MKKLSLILGVCLVAMMGFGSINVGASSSNAVSRVDNVRDKENLNDVYLKIIPKDEVTTGAVIYIDFTNAKVFDQKVIDSSYQYLQSGKRWNGEGFYEFMPKVSTSKLPYSLKRMSNTKLEVTLINVPQEYCNIHMNKINGSNSSPIYYIPMVISADGTGDIKAVIDSNNSTISGSKAIKVGTVGASTTKASTTSATTSEVTTTTESITESITETTTHEAQYNKSVKATIKNSSLFVDGTGYEVGVAPYIQLKSSSMMMPLRAVAIALGGDLNSMDDSKMVKWDSVNKVATIYYLDKIISFKSGSNIVTVDGKEITMSNGVYAEIVDGRMYVPFRALGEALGVVVDWDPDTKTAVYYKE